MKATDGVQKKSGATASGSVLCSMMALCPIIPQPTQTRSSVVKWLILATNVSLVAKFLQYVKQVAVVELSRTVRLIPLWDLRYLHMANQREILKDVLCQVSIHDLPVEHVLKYTHFNTWTTPFCSYYSINAPFAA